jgi:hypothetical protein
MNDFKSHGEMMRDSPVSEAAFHRASSALSEAAEAMEAILKRDKRDRDLERGVRYFEVGVGREGYRNMRICAQFWRISVPSLVRIALADVMARHGFATQGVLLAKDYVSLQRPDSANKPMQTKEESAAKSHRERSWNVPFTGADGGDNPPQPPELHGPGDQVDPGIVR